jgi:predicted nucleic-acid-binding protein
MIVIDTNVLLRRLLQDDSEQSKRANRLFEQKDRILITDIVLAETIWTLKGKRYDIDKTGIVAVVISLLEEPGIIFESTQAVWSALNDYFESKLADFTDALIVNKAKETAKHHSEIMEAVYTFDHGALALPGAKSPK